MMNSLIFGFLIGMRHALEADHVAAVSTLAVRGASVSDTVRQGVAWGVGHALSLSTFGAVVLVLDAAVPERLALLLELCVAIMLVLLGADLLRCLTGRLRLLWHAHGDHGRHLHAHSRDAPLLDPAWHEHVHARGYPIRALVIGLMHGMAGSAALTLLALGTVRSPLTGMLVLLLFGIGAMLGMAALSLAIAIPLYRNGRTLSGLQNWLQAAAGLSAIALGAIGIAQSLEAL